MQQTLCCSSGQHPRADALEVVKQATAVRPILLVAAPFRALNILESLTGGPGENAGHNAVMAQYARRQSRSLFVSAPRGRSSVTSRTTN